MMGLLQRVANRLQALVGRGKVTLVDDIGGTVQRLQARFSALELRDGIPRLAEFGFTSLPPDGSDCVAIYVGGDRSNGVVIATGNQTYRLKGLASGDAALYDSRGQSVWLTQNGIVIEGAGLPLTIRNTPTVTMPDTTLLDLPNGDVTASGISLKSHTHGGVQPGSGSTGAPQ